MNTSSDAVVRERFESVVDTVDDSDWDDVIARAGLVDTSRVSRSAFAFRRRAALVAVFAAFALGVGATLVSGAPFRGGSSTANAPGPGQVQRQVGNGTIAWLFRHQPRGESLAAAHIAPLSLVGSHWQPTRFARVLVPDPVAGEKIAVSLIGKHGRNICMTVFLARSGFGGCAIGLLLKPFNVSTAGGLGFGRRAEHRSLPGSPATTCRGCRSFSLTDEADRCRSETTRSSSASRRQTFR